jgi:hypothetical protein
VAALFEDPEDVSFKLVSISASFGVPYKDVGAEVVYQRKTKNREQAMIRSLERSGYIVPKVATA